MLAAMKSRVAELRGAPLLFQLLLVVDPLVGFDALGYGLLGVGESTVDPILRALPHTRAVVAAIGVLAFGQAWGLLATRPFGLALYLAPFLLAHIATPVWLFRHGAVSGAWLLADLAVAAFFMLYGWLNRRWFGLGRD